MGLKILPKLSLALFLGVASCASYNPYVSPDYDTYFAGKSDTLISSEIKLAVDLAERWRGKANDAANEDLAANALILPTALTAANFALTGDRGEAAITTLASIALGGWTYRELARGNPRQAIYISGISALECLAYNASPLSVDRRTLNQLNRRLNAVRRDSIPASAYTAELGAEIMAIRAESAQWSPAGKAELAQMESLLALANAEIADATTSIEAADALKAKLNEAPQALRSQIGKIHVEVDRQLGQQQATPEMILQIANGFGTALGKFVKGLSPAPAGNGITNTNAMRGIVPQGGGAPTLSEQNALANLRVKQANIQAVLPPFQTAKSVLKSIVGANGDAINAVSTFQDCTVETTTKPLAITPSDTLREVTADTHTITIEGGSGYYNVTKVGRNADGFEINYSPSTLPTQTDVNFIVTDKFTGDQSIRIRDTSNLNVAPIDVTFRAKPADTGTPGPPSNQPGSNPPTGTSQVNPITFPDGIVSTNARRTRFICSPSPSDQETRILQSAFIGSGIVGFDRAFIDGDWGPNSKAAARDYLDQFGIRIVDPDLLACTITDLMERDLAFRNRVLFDAGKIAPKNMRCENWTTLEYCWQNAQN